AVAPPRPVPAWSAAAHAVGECRSGHPACAPVPRRTPRPRSAARRQRLLRESASPASYKLERAGGGLPARSAIRQLAQLHLHLVRIISRYLLGAALDSGPVVAPPALGAHQKSQRASGSAK